MKSGLNLVNPAILLAGATATLAQVILIREFLVTFGGNELHIGIILASWLLMGAVGSLLASRLLRESEREIEVYVSLQLAVAVFLPATVYGVRMARILFGIIPGEAVGLSAVFQASMILLAPLAIAHGAQFTTGCRVHARLTKRHSSSIARVYAYEALGTLSAGFIFTFFLVSRFNSMETVLGAAALNLASAVMLSILWMKGAYRGDSSRLNRGVCLLLLGCIMLAFTGYLLSGAKSGDLHTQSIRRQWEPHDLRYYGNSTYGNIAVVERGGEFTFYSNGVPVATTPHPDETLMEELAHLPMLFHASPRHVLLLGGGVGGLLNEILKHPAARVDYIEPDPMFISVVQRFSTPLTQSELGDARLVIRQLDGRTFMTRTQQQYDVILVNLPSPSTLQLNRFYTVEFFQAARDALSEDGILAVRCPGSLTYVGEEMADLIACFRLTLGEVFPHVRPIAGDPVLLLASPSPGIAAVSFEVLAQRLNERGLETRFLTDLDLRYRLDEERTNQLLASLDRASDVRVNRDLVPAGLFYDMSLLGTLVFPELARTLNLMGRASLWTFLLPLALVSAATVALRRRRGKATAFSVPFAIATNGFAGMALQMILILAFQSLYGGIYQMVGLLIATFMTGLAAGSSWMSRFVERVEGSGSSLVRLESLVLAQAILVLIALDVLYAHQGQPAAFAMGQAAILTLSLVSGALVGSEYVLATAVYLRVTHSVGKTASTLYAADLIGAWMGALLVSTWFIPVLGIPRTCILVAGLKATSLILVRFSPSPTLFGSGGKPTLPVGDIRRPATDRTGPA